MALLLAMYQKMRLIREKNQATYDLTKYSSKLDRVTKNIERVQKRYTSLFAKLESQAKQMQSTATMQLQNMAGIGTNCVNVNSYSGMNGFIYNIMGNMLSQGGMPYKDSNGNEQKLDGMSQSDIQNMMNEYMSNGGQFIRKKDPNDDTKYLQNEYENWSPEQVQAFFQAYRAGQMQQQQAQTWVNNATQQYGNNVSIWLEAQKAQLEAEQDAALEPLNYQETMWELEKTQADNKLKRINAQLESYDQLVSQESEKSAPTFGLR